MKVFNTTMCRMRYQDDDASMLCLFFLSIWLCLTLIVKKIVAFGQAMGAATATLAAVILAVAKAAAILAVAKAAAILAAA